MYRAWYLNQSKNRSYSANQNDSENYDNPEVSRYFRHAPILI